MHTNTHTYTHTHTHTHAHPRHTRITHTNTRNTTHTHAHTHTRAQQQQQNNRPTQPNPNATQQTRNTGASCFAPFCLLFSFVAPTYSSSFSLGWVFVVFFFLWVGFFWVGFFCFLGFCGVFFWITWWVKPVSLFLFIHACSSADCDCVRGWPREGPLGCGSRSRLPQGGGTVKSLLLLLRSNRRRIRERSPFIASASPTNENRAISLARPWLRSSVRASEALP